MATPSNKSTTLNCSILVQRIIPDNVCLFKVDSIVRIGYFDTKTFTDIARLGDAGLIVYLHVIVLVELLSS